jgi:hypothetical protein
MTDYVPGLVLGALGIALFALGRWGRGNAESLVPAAMPANRQGKELRTIGRGALWCAVFGAFCAVNGAVLIVVAASQR